jgi:hypothetical protein
MIYRIRHVLSCNFCCIDLPSTMTSYRLLNYDMIISIIIGMIFQNNVTIVVRWSENDV